MDRRQFMTSAATLAATIVLPLNSVLAGRATATTGLEQLAWAAPSGGRLLLRPSDNVVERVADDGRTLWQFTAAGTGDLELNGPRALAVTSSGLIAVGNHGNSTVLLLDHNGRPQSVIGGWGSGDGQLRYPGDVVAGQSDTLWVADTLNHRVQKFATDGRPLAVVGQFGTGTGELNGPSGLTFDDDGLLHVANKGNGCVTVFDRRGRFLHSYGNGELIAPRAIVAAGGRIWVADPLASQVVAFDNRGQRLGRSTYDIAPVGLSNTGSELCVMCRA